MNLLLDEILQQPQALRDLLSFYRQAQDNPFERLGSPVTFPVFTGIGASYHAAWTGALHLNNLGIPAHFFEAADLVHYLPALLRQHPMLGYISQSGLSGSKRGWRQGRQPPPVGWKLSQWSAASSSSVTGRMLSPPARRR